MILEVKDVHAYYKDSHVLFGMDFGVDEGESVCLIGRNGAGKTTTMKAIMGMMNPVHKCTTKGSILFDGKEICGKPTYAISKAGMGYVPQGRHIFSMLTVRENLEIAERKGVGGEMTWTMERIFELFPRLKERLNFKGPSLSGGEQQMLAVARGLVQNPRILLLDEITEGLAPIIVDELAEIIAELRRQGVTVLVAEQNMKFALKVSDRCCILEKGKIVYSDKTSEIPQEIFTKYLGV